MAEEEEAEEEWRPSDYDWNPATFRAKKRALEGEGATRGLSLQEEVLSDISFHHN